MSELYLLGEDQDGIVIQGHYTRAEVTKNIKDLELDEKPTGYFRREYVSFNEDEGIYEHCHGNCKDAMKITTWGWHK